MFDDDSACIELFRGGRRGVRSIVLRHDESVHAGGSIDAGEQPVQKDGFHEVQHDVLGGKA
ncbi:MAG: hypothetical protein ACREH3_07710, partial [Geminicoccales bacterium]